MPCKVGSIRKIHERLVREGYEISEYALRQWVKASILPAAHSGSKALISFDKVVELLDAANASP